MGISCKMLHINEGYVLTLSALRSKTENIFKIFGIPSFLLDKKMLHLQNGFTDFNFLPMVCDLKIPILCIMCLSKQQFIGVQLSRNYCLQFSGVIDKKKLREYEK